MIHIWRSPQQISNKHVCLFSNSDFQICSAIKHNEAFNKSEKVCIEFGDSLNYLEKLEALPNSARLPIIKTSLINEIKEMLEGVSSLQLDVKCTDGISKDYSILIIENKVKAIDHNQSISKKAMGVLFTFEKLVLKENCLGKVQLARDEDYPELILIGDELSSHINCSLWDGLWQAQPEEIYP